MPSFARKYLLPESGDFMVHAISRCVRRSWLCGEDSYTGKNFDHRRQWVRERAIQLVGAFAIEVCAFAVMSNHSHFVLWCRPTLAATWRAEEVVERWLRVFGKGQKPPTPAEIARLAANPVKVELWRQRLGSVSWFMRCLNEWLARKANEEDDCTGRFWEGRFYCQLLADEGAVLACMAYVDLNPMRAKAAACLEESLLTGGHDRLVASRARKKLADAQGNAKDDGREVRADEWLSPLGEAATGHPVMGIGVESYLEMLEWTGQCMAEGKRGKLPPALIPLLERMDLEVERWVETVEKYGSHYYRVSGKVETLRQKAADWGQQWVAGQRKSRGVFRSIG